MNEMLLDAGFMNGVTSLFVPNLCSEQDNKVSGALAPPTKIPINQINRPFQPLLNLSDNWSLATCIANLSRIHEKLLKLSSPQGQIIDVKCEKRNKSAILTFFSHYQTCQRTGDK